MRLPQPLLESQFFALSSAKDLVSVLSEKASLDEVAEIQRLTAAGLPPVTSRAAMAAMIGINPGLIWSFENRTKRHYRSFTIPKGNGQRMIDAPRVALKVIQKWLSVQLQRAFLPDPHVFGFVSGRSHVGAASCHVNAKWVFSVDIADYFQTTPLANVQASLRALGYGEEGAALLAKISCLNGFLAQGAPSSPVLSNLVFADVDRLLSQVAERYGVRLSRYADDIVFSGETIEFPHALRDEVEAIIAKTPWRLNPGKTELHSLPKRLKVHGLLVHGDRVRLTKGYRNKLRAFRHSLTKGRVQPASVARIRGHLIYADFISTQDFPQPG